ncbi:catenin alpha-3 isoform X3 [Anolis carolinensis]|uniref:catenin alpha-3 isoform X3 n=1 Tax=Anolis carolinensis TaxID=28377 RepID=UPI002F2B7C41
MSTVCIQKQVKMAAGVPHMQMKIDPQNLQIQTRTVEKLLEPLIIQVTTLMNCPQNPSNKKKGCSKRARVILASVEEATWNLLDKGEKIAKEAPVFVDELNAALHDVRKESEALKISAKTFTDDPCYVPKREAVVQVARTLLAAVTRLLILADMIDVSYLLQHLTTVQRTFESLRKVSTRSEMQKIYKNLQGELKKLDHLACKRQQDLKSNNQRDDIAAARASLKENLPLLHSICSACLEHSDIMSLAASKDSVCNEIQNALDVISNASQGIGNQKVQPIPQAATLGSALDELENVVTLEPLTVNEEKIRPTLEKRLEAIISGAALLADSSCTRDLHRERIITECNAIRQALQDLLSEYMNNADKKERSNALNTAIDNMCKKTRDLRRQLRKAIIDHISDSFLDTTVPLLVLTEAAKNGREQEIKEYAAIFKEHTCRLIEPIYTTLFRCHGPCCLPTFSLLQLCMAQYLHGNTDNPLWVANLACSVSTNKEGIKIAQTAASQMETLCPQVINAALALAARPQSQVVKSNMEIYRSTWEKHIRVLTEAVDDITSIDDFLAVSVIPEFITQVNTALGNLSRNTIHLFDDNQFVDISKKVYDTIHDIRCSVMMIRTPEELEGMSDLEDDYDARSCTSIQTEGKTDRAKMTQLPEAEREKIAEQVADFKKVKSKLDAEIEIWDDTSNDIIVLAKRMCVIMMEMTDFTRGRGPLKNTSDVINAARMISESGSRMDMLARLISNQCPDPSCKQDLLAYLEQVKLYSHQLKICSQVKAEIQNLGGELIVSALDSVTSLIQAAKNLMNAVVQTVKMSYIASSKIIRIQSPAGPRHPVVMWRMKVPEKKPLIKREKPEEIYAAVRKGSAKKKIHPVQIMSEFRGREIN